MGVEDFVALAPLPLLLDIGVHFSYSVGLGGGSIRADHGPLLLPGGPASGMERRGWLATLCLTIRQSEPDFANIRYLFEVNMIFFYLKILNNMNLNSNTVKQYKTLSFSTFTEINSK